MAEPIARIRPYVKDDSKLVHFYVGKAQMEGLAIANRKVTLHPLTLAAWVALSCIFIQYLHWWPQPELGWWTYLKPLPAFAAWSLPLMFLVDWYNRPYFEDRVQKVLRRPDLVNIYDYYFERSPSSGLWLLEYGDKFVGFIAIDASPDATSEDTVVSAAEAGKTFKGKNAEFTSDVASIRHFYIQEEYRPSFVQDDLLEHAVEHAFSSHKAVKTIRAADSTLTPWLSEALRKQGFVSDKVIGQLGMLKWPIRSRVLTRKRWDELRQDKDH